MRDLAILGYRASNNLGDPVQSYALLSLMGDIPVSHVVDRDNMRDFAPAAPTTLVVNGWLSQKPEGLRLNPGVTGLFLSIHLTDTHGIYSRQRPMAQALTHSPALQDLFRRAEPVGARDAFTLGLLESLGIEAYFSGCLTLHLVPRGVNRGKHVLAIDVDPNTVTHLRRRLSRPVVAASNVSNCAWLSVEDLKAESDSYLDLIASSHLVVSSRLHAALPAVAMGIPTIFAPPTLEDPRFGGLLDFIPVAVPMQNLPDLPSSAFEPPFPTALRRPSELFPVVMRQIERALSKE